MKVKILENAYEIIWESYGAEIWRLKEGCKETDVIQGSCCKKVLRICRFVANGVAELEL
jgi:hypothetical protein